MRKKVPLQGIQSNKEVNGCHHSTTVVIEEDFNREVPRVDRVGGVLIQKEAFSLTIGIGRELIRHSSASDTMSNVAKRKEKQASGIMLNGNRDEDGYLVVSADGGDSMEERGISGDDGDDWGWFPRGGPSQRNQGIPMEVPVQQPQQDPRELERKVLKKVLETSGLELHINELSAHLEMPVPQLKIFLNDLNQFLISEEDTVSLQIGLKICEAYLLPDGCSGDCNGLHMCYKYVAKKCSRGDSCEEGHDFKTNHNTKILRKFHLEDADSQLLLKLMQSSGDVVVVPGICDYYNVGECKYGSGCTKMHLCLNYILGTCNDGCQLNHDILESHCERLLKNSGVKMDSSRKDLKNFLKREWQKEQKLDAIAERKEKADQEKQRRRQLEEAARRKVFHADEDDGEVEVPEVCIFLLNDRCLDGERGRCKRLHAGTPYHWQVKNPVTNKWINLSKNQSFRLEQNFADPSKVKVQLDSFTSEEVHLTKRSQLRSLFQDESYEVDFIGMKLRNMQTQARMDIRRLSTESHVMTGGKKHSTIWCWHFLDISGKWMEYGATTAEHSSSSDLKSADIEKQYCTAQGNGRITFSTNKFKYEINFQTMKQKNLQTNKQRDILRRPAPPDGSSNQVNVLKYRHVPSHWVPMQETETCKMVPLDPGSQEYLNVAALMPGFTVRKITRVQNPYLWEMYQNRRLVLLKKYNNNAGRVSYLCGIGGKDGKESIIHMVKALISKDVAQEYSFLGKKGKKCFKELMICKSITVAAKKLALTEKEEMKEVSPMVMTTQDLPMLIPLNTLDDLQLYEELLSADHTACADLVSYLRGIGGKDGKESIIHMVKALISKNVAQEYSFLGKKGKKCFKELMICK
ncbi:unnamed protein product [Darwinula stevensoni]|uniref:Uncharacterized protein n=1 Tax=Darwinula stevensoni TaxID=69355 RepID=A0A7R8X6N7_9CRUS|nr:unnamed protein product [Darwinula stevensoni]CAG0887068.1 unnamed protein product [Darwinula stevensoni]